MDFDAETEEGRAVIYGMIRFYVKDPDRAEDYTQDFYMKKIFTLKNDIRLKSIYFVKKMVKYFVIDQIRTEKTIKNGGKSIAKSLEDLVFNNQAGILNTDPSQDPVTQFLNKEAAYLTQKVKESLSQKYHLCIDYYYFDSPPRTKKAIAQELGVSEKTAAKYLKEAVVIFRRRYLILCFHLEIFTSAECREILKNTGEEELQIDEILKEDEKWFQEEFGTNVGK